MVQLFALVACVVLLGLAVFQVLLASGRPLGNYAWGGKHSVLPVGLRIGSAISVFVYCLFALVILDRAGLWQSGGRINWGAGIWPLVVYFAVGVLVNAISRSKQERAVMTPVAAVLLICTLIIALL